MTPEVSVIVAIFNCSAYLEKCLQSIAKQSVKQGFEVICVNDGSTDGSELIVGDFYDKIKNIKLINQENEGLSSARNKGLEFASGKYVVFVDGDDTLGNLDGATGQELQHLIGAMTENVDFAMGKVDIVYEANEYMKESDELYYKLPPSGNLLITPENALHIHCSAWSKIYRKSIIDRYHLKFPEGLHYEDAYWHLCYTAVAPKGRVIKETVYCYYRHPAGIMNDTFEKKHFLLALDHVLIGEKVYNFFVENQILHGREQLVTDMLEQHLQFAINFSSAKEHSYIRWRTWKILSENKIDTRNNVVLSSLALEFSSQPIQIDPLIIRDAARWRKVYGLITKLCPVGSYRYKVLRRCYEWLKRLNVPSLSK